VSDDPLCVIASSLRDINDKIRLGERLSEVELEARALKGWSIDYVDHNTKDKARIMKSVDGIAEDMAGFKNKVIGFLMLLIVGLVAFIFSGVTVTIG